MSTTVTLELPPEFLELCEADRTEPETVLRGFIADLCEIRNYASAPREDGYCSNGSDERMLARQYYERVGYPYLKEWVGFTRGRERRSPMAQVAPTRTPILAGRGFSLGGRGQ